MPNRRRRAAMWSIATPLPLSERRPRVALIYAQGHLRGKRDSALDEPRWRSTLS